MNREQRLALILKAQEPLIPVADEDGKKAGEIILRHVVTNVGRPLWTGGCTPFKAPGYNLPERGPCKLLVFHDGGDLRDFVPFGSSGYAKLDELLRAEGLYLEQIDSVSSGVYRVVPEAKKPSSPEFCTGCGFGVDAVEKTRGCLFGRACRCGRKETKAARLEWLRVAMSDGEAVMDAISRLNERYQREVEAIEAEDGA